MRKKNMLKMTKCEILDGIISAKLLFNFVRQGKTPTIFHTSDGEVGQLMKKF